MNNRAPDLRVILIGLGLATGCLVMLAGTANALGPPHNASFGIDCEDCHAMHQGGLMGALVPRDRAQEALCRSCHNPTGMAAAFSNVALHEPEAGARLIDCGACHDPHGPHETTDPRTGTTAFNLGLVRSNTDKYVPEALGPVIFQLRPDDFSWDSSPYTGICQSCHTATNYHTNDGVDPHHNEAADCTTCHKHEDGFAPSGCTGCHSEPQNLRRQIVEAGGDFERPSHHVRGSVEDSDCLVCHYVRNHGSQIVKLRDPDQGDALVHEYDSAAPEDLEGFCLGCHDSDGASYLADGAHPFGDGLTPPNVEGLAGSEWINAAHKTEPFSGNGDAPITCMGDGVNTGCHGNAHGSDNEKILSADSGLQTIEQLCFNCHTDGRVTNDALSSNRTGGYVSADDIEEAFAKSRKHDVGGTFSVGGNTYTLQCTSCHNPHVVTGSYWDAALGVSPVTRPDLSADPVTNPRAMGSTLWGATPGEKTDDFAAQGSGTGGWYFSTARGGTISNDQPARYQPPKDGTGNSFEFAGDILPDYTTLCLDCHSNRVNAAIPPVNWGQGIGCTDNSVDPPNQRVECGADHGLGMAGKPAYVSDEGTAGFWGSSGNPDMIFNMNYVTRGRHNGHFMRWPYDSAERSAGINFVMACTDCHEAHGSDRGGMIRERFNVNANGDCGSGGDTDPNGENCTDGSNWNSYCNACHYYYGGHHAGMSCGNASCHEANSIHRIIHVTGSGAGTQLMLTAAGWESNFQRPDFTPEIQSVAGHTGSNELVVTFQPSLDAFGIYGNEDLTGALDVGDFWIFDTDGNNPKSITSVSHLAGEYSATLTLSAVLTAADVGSDTLAARGMEIWDWYAGGYQNAATGTIPAQAVSAGPWPVIIDGPPPLGILSAAYGSGEIRVTMTEGVWGSGAAGVLLPGDFTLSDCGGRTITGVTHTPGGASAILMLDSALALSDIGVCTAATVGGVISDGYGNYANVTVVALSLPAECPIGTASFQLNEPAASPYTFDGQYRFPGIVGNPAVALPGDGTFHGDPDQVTYIDFTSNGSCLNEADTVSIELQFKTGDVDLDYDGPDDITPGDQDPATTATFSRLFERKRAIKATIMRADYGLDNVDSRAGKARIQVKYFVDTASRHTCPHPSWPDDTYVGNDARWHQVNTDIDNYPIVSDHWYRARVVFNSAKAHIPVDIWVDDLGTNDPVTDPDVGELWSGFINTAMPNVEDSSSCKWGALPGDYIALEEQPWFIGATENHNSLFIMKGQIDWVTWKAAADYTGVDDGPHTGP